MNLAAIVDRHPDADVAVTSRGRPTTYGELRAAVAGLRRGLADLGVRPGDRVALLAANNLVFVTGLLAALGAGAVAVPLNPDSPAPEQQRQLGLVRPRAAVVGPRAAGAFARLDRRRLPELRALVAPRGVALDGAAVWDDLVAGPGVPPVERGADDLAVLAFTAGTAGVPRAAMLTHGNLLANLHQLRALPGRALGPGDVALGALPLFHVFGLNLVLNAALIGGASVVLVERFDPATALDTLRERGVTVVSGVPSMWSSWAALPDARGDAFAHVRVAVSGAAPLGDEVADAVERRYGVVVHQGYGLTEAGPAVSSSAGERRRGSVGRPLPGVEVRLVEPDGQDALLGDEGEVWVRGANVFRGYWQDEEATRSALTPDGWLRTGDVAVADDDGWLYLVDRLTDLVIVSGFNVYPAEVEEVLLEHPGVAAAAVVGVPHPHTGEALRAYVVPAPGHALEEDEVVAFVGTRLARYKCPAKVLFVDAIPQGLGGKILRRALRAPTGAPGPP